MSAVEASLEAVGHNVWPLRIAELLRQLDGVADAAVRLDASSRLQAFIVPNDGRNVAELTAMIERAAIDRLSMPERPRNLRLGAALPRNALGKLGDWV